VELLLKYGAQPDFEDEGERTPLSRAIETGNTAVIELLLAQGAKVDYQYNIPGDWWPDYLYPLLDRLGGWRTPLSRAAEKGDKVVVELLLKNGAQPELKDLDGQTPLSRTDSADVVQLLNRASGD